MALKKETLTGMDPGIFNKISLMHSSEATVDALLWYGCGLLPWDSLLSFNASEHMSFVCSEYVNKLHRFSSLLRPSGQTPKTLQQVLPKLTQDYKDAVDNYYEQGRGDTDGFEKLYSGKGGKFNYAFSRGSLAICEKNKKGSGKNAGDTAGAGVLRTEAIHDLVSRVRHFSFAPQIENNSAQKTKDN